MHKNIHILNFENCKLFNPFQKKGKKKSLEEQK